MTETAELLLNQEDWGPETRLVVTYVRGVVRRGVVIATNRCTLPCRFVEERPNGDLVVETERVNTRTQEVVSRRLRTILKAELLTVEPVA